MKKTIRLFVLTAFFTLLMQNPGRCQEITDHPAISYHRLTVLFNESTRTYELYDADEGFIMSAGIIKSVNENNPVATDDPRISRKVKSKDNNKLIIEFDNSFIVEAALEGDSALSFRIQESSVNTFSLTARAPLSDRTMAAILLNEKANDNNTLVQTFGKDDIPGQKSIFDPYKDLAIQLESDGKAGWDFFHQWEINACAKTGQTLCRIKLIRHYYRDRLGITYYAPVKKRSYFQKAPALAMTWVGIEGKFNRPDFSQRKEWLYPNIDWVAQHLLPYAGEMVFQLDDNYPIDDPQYMRDISDYIRSRGLIPGIWLAPFGVAPYKETETHPDWFIHKADGTPITTFSGLSYDDYKHYNSAVLNVNNREAVDKWFAGFLRKISEDWNYDYFKIDGIPAALTVYQNSVDGGGVEGVRRGLQIIRSVLGPDKYINTCWGLPIEGIDIVNGSRVGGDTEQLDQVISRVSVRENFLNNVAWYSDPDGAANMYASTVSRARLNFLGRAILGQPYVTDDNWTKVPDKILNVWKKTLPTIESFPVNLYRIKDGEKYIQFDLKITKPWGKWDVVALNNYKKSDRLVSLELEKLALDAERVYVYDFWNGKYLGKFDNDADITRNMKAIDAHCFNLVPVQTERPVLLSTNRHFTQGGIDIEKMTSSMEGDRWIISGVSVNLVSNDPYELVFKTNGYTLKEASATCGQIKITGRDGLGKVRITPDGNKTEWEVAFSPDEKTSVCFGSELIHVIPGVTTQIPVVVNNGTPKWKVRSNDRSVKIKKDRKSSAVSIAVDPSVIQPEKTLSAYLILESKNASVYTDSLLLEVQGPDRVNIAPQAKTEASSIYFWGDQNGYGRPAGANDGLSFKAWEAAEGETSGWIELMWKEPVTFQRIVIDEWLESKGNIQSWTLEAGHKKYEYTPRIQTQSVVTYEPDKEYMKEIASGDLIGRGYVIELEKPVTANALRLRINKASDRPGVWEIEVNPPENLK